MKFIIKLINDSGEIIAETELNAADIGRALPPAIAWLIQTYESKNSKVIVPEYSVGTTLADILREGYAGGTWATVEGDERGTWSLQMEHGWLES